LRAAGHSTERGERQNDVTIMPPMRHLVRQFIVSGRA
jgi:hypothetical protein